MKQIRNKTSFFILLVLLSAGVLAKDYPLNSPNGNIKVVIHVEDQITWSASVSGHPVFNRNKIAMDLGTVVLGSSPKLISAKKSSVSETQNTLIAVKSRKIDDTYNQLHLKFKKDFALSFRVFNNGIAYRFETFQKDKLTINGEEMELNFAGDFGILFPEEESFLSHFERSYLDQKISSLEAGRFCSLPALVKGNENIKIGITEADLSDYPCLFLEATGKASLKSKFPHVILELEQPSDRHVKILKEADFIAATDGTRSFPWRVFMISEEDARLVENQMVYLLSRDSKLTETGWIKPGLIAWDWWNDNNIYGVGFKSGINTETYKYYIDFASKYKIPYIILDEGWSKTTTNVLEPNSDINIKELVSYGKSKNVDLILWSLWEPVDKDMDNILDQFVEWGVKGLKVDFMARADQYMVNFFERTAIACANRKLIVDFHGAYKPTGLHKTYPNVLNFEGVKGLEHGKWSNAVTPEHDVTICFTRMLAGPMDYTPGAMRNYHPKDFYPLYSQPASQGTRCHQLAMYVVYDAPLQMLADSPTSYYKESESTSFISKMKTEWDETIILDAKVADYIVTARRNNQDWYIGALTDSTQRNLDISFSFLEDGEYDIEIMQDGVNADKAAVDYQYITKTINRNSNLSIEMASGGGWVAICRKK